MPKRVYTGGNRAKRRKERFLYLTGQSSIWEVRFGKVPEGDGWRLVASPELKVPEGHNVEEGLPE